MEYPCEMAVIGGDGRMTYAANALARRGYRVGVFGMDRGVPSEGLPFQSLENAVLSAPILIFPVPFSKDGKTLFAPFAPQPIYFETLFSLIPKSTRCFGGMLNTVPYPNFSDYAEKPSFAADNAVSTAEGALALALGEIPAVLFKMPVAILGFGRVGKATASLFHRAGADVTVLAGREETVALAKTLGYFAVRLTALSDTVSRFRLVINTVPSPIVDDKTLAAMQKNSYYMELASPPYGVDFGRAARYPIHVIRAGGLPGKFSPETAGDIICKTVLSML